MFSAPLVFLMYMSSQMEVFYFELKAMFLNQCDNQKNYSSVCYRIEEKEMECNWFLPFLIFKNMVGPKWDRSDKIKVLISMKLWLKELRNQKAAHFNMTADTQCC